MLGYLDALIAALTLRDSTEADRLLGHPLARLLPEDVRAEAQAFALGASDALAAPLRTMRLRHQTSQLLRDQSLADQPLADQPDARPSVHAEPPSLRRGARPQQMELPLSA
ncbi:MAG: hypothetical protein KF709_07325 [Gemmatimonadaceae bacterium]|nr:hypothetical protein [Gemmatimonadaceae bacterium]